MTIIFQDTFTGTETLATHTTDSGHTWVDQVTGWGCPSSFVLADGLTQLPSVWQTYIRPNILQPSDFVLTIGYLHAPADGYPVDSISQALVLFFDAAPEDSYGTGYEIYMQNTTGELASSISILKAPYWGEGATLATTNFTATMGSHSVIIERVGSNFTLTRNNTVLLSTTLVPKLAGSTIWQHNSGNPGTYLDSYTLSTPIPPPPPAFWQDIHGATEIP